MGLPYHPLYQKILDCPATSFAKVAGHPECNKSESWVTKRLTNKVPGTITDMKKIEKSYLRLAKGL